MKNPNYKFTKKYDSTNIFYRLSPGEDLVSVFVNPSKNKDYPLNRIQAFIQKGILIKRILMSGKQKFLEGNYFELKYKVQYIGHRINPPAKLYQLHQIY